MSDDEKIAADAPPTVEEAMATGCLHCALLMFIQAWGQARLKAGKPTVTHDEVIFRLGEAAADAIAVYPHHAAKSIEEMFAGMQRGFEGTGIEFRPTHVRAERATAH